MTKFVLRLTTSLRYSKMADSTMNKALKNADINSDDSRSLFDIVSRRYQLSAPARLGN